MIQAETSNDVQNLQYQGATNATEYASGENTPATSNTPTPNPEQHINGTQRKLREQIYHWWHKAALILLIFHGLVGLWESIRFIFIEYPELSHLLKLHQVQSSEMNSLLSRAIITTTTTLVNVFFAIRLAKVKETTAHNIDLLVSTFLIVSTKIIQNYLINLDLLNLVLNVIST